MAAQLSCCLYEMHEVTTNPLAVPVMPAANARRLLGRDDNKGNDKGNSGANGNAITNSGSGSSNSNGTTGGSGSGSKQKLSRWVRLGWVSRATALCSLQARPCAATMLACCWTCPHQLTPSRMCMQEALESAQSKLSSKMNSTISAHLRDKVAARRPVAGLGARHDDRRLYVALPGNGTVDAKLDVPSVALVGAWRTAAAGSTVAWWSRQRHCAAG